MEKNALIRMDDVISFKLKGKDTLGIVATVQEGLFIVNILPTTTGKSAAVPISEAMLVARKGTKKYSYLTQGSLPVKITNQNTDTGMSQESYDLFKLQKQYEKALQGDPSKYTLTEADYDELIDLALDMNNEELFMLWSDEKKKLSKTC